MKKGFLAISKEVIPNIKAIQEGHNVDENFQTIDRKFRPIIEKIIKKVAYPGSIDRDDLAQEGRIALWRCCHKYNIDSDASFYTYFSSTALKALTNYVFKYQLPITVNKHEMEKTKVIRSFSKEFYNINGEAPTMEDYKEAGFDEELAARFKFLVPASFTPSQENTEEIESIESSESLEETVARNINSELLYQSLDKLEPLARSVIVLHCLEGKTYKEVSDSLGISVAAIRIYQKEGFKLLREDLESKIK